MPLPWKKARVNRISRLVADLHQSPKHGGSLVVETGFPTSLIDLFVKNRDRLRKPSKRKSSPSPSPTEIQTPPTLYQPSPLPKPFPSRPCKEELRSPEIDVGKLELVKKECEERIAFRAALKIFLVVALAVSSRNLAVCFMVAAFLLVLIEFVGARLFGFLRPESKVLFLDSWIQKGLLVLKRWDWEQGSSPQELDLKQQGALFSDSYGLIELEDYCVEEIQIAESKCESESLETEIREEEMEKRREILICRSERSRSARIKANLIKKLVPKKLRNGKKLGKHDPCSQSGLDIDKSEKVEEGKQGSEADDGEDESKVEEESFKQVEQVGDRISTCTQEESEMGLVKNRVENDRKGKSGYPILFVIVLAGLVGGRGLALLLTLLWCLTVRYIRLGRLRRG